MRAPRRHFSALALATTGAALALWASPTVAKDPQLTGPVSQPPGSLGQATVVLKVHFGRKSHGSKKLVAKNLLGKAYNVYWSCLDGHIGYPGGGGDASTRSKIDFEDTMFVNKKGSFHNTVTYAGDTNTSTYAIQGKFTGRRASGTIRIENHENDGSRNPGDPQVCDSGVLTWTAP